MTTMRNAVSKVARLLGVTTVGQEPTGHDAADLLGHMQSVIDRLPGLRDGAWRDVLLSSDADYTANDGERISPQGFDPVITLPTTFADDGGVMRILEDLSRVQVIGDGLYVWSSTLGAWNRADGLTANDPFPFGPEDLPGIVALTVLEAADEYGAEASQMTALRATEALTSFSSRFYREVAIRAEDSVLRLSETGLQEEFG